MPAPNDPFVGLKIDRERPHALVYGESRHRYEQDGLFFGPDGAYVGRSKDWKPPAKPVASTGLTMGAFHAKLKDLNLRAEFNRPLQISDTPRLMKEYQRLTGMEWRGKREGLIKAIRQIYRRVVDAVSRQIPEAIIDDWVSAPSVSDAPIGEDAVPPRDPDDEDSDGEPQPEIPEQPDGDDAPAQEVADAALMRDRAKRPPRTGRLPSRDIEAIADAAAANRAAGVQAGNAFNEDETF